MALGAARGSFLHRWRLLGIDGFEVEGPDSKANAAEFGCAGSGDNRSAFPEARVVALAEYGTCGQAVRGYTVSPNPVWTYRSGRHSARLPSCGWSNEDAGGDRQATLHRSAPVPSS